MSSEKRGGRFHHGIASRRVSEGFESSAIEEYLSALGCPRALAVAMLYKYKEHGQLAKLEFNPKHYNNLVGLRSAYSATKFLSKFEGLKLGYDLDQVALEKFDAFELLCKQTNRRFRDLQLDPLFKGPAVWVHNASIRKIDRILGDFSADELFSMPDWGPGASTLIKRRDASPAKKFRLETGITRDLYNLIPWETLAEAYPVWADQLVSSGFPNFQVGNKVITVSKDATTNRVIAVEPGMNMFFQKAIGDMIGKRLLRCGIDLRYQSTNQDLARIGSKDSTLATIDLSSASDSIASNVVWALLPPRWWMLLDACRSHYGVRDEKPVKWEKFSSMGNGFTFQLESLIFYAVASSCAEYLSLGTKQVSVYGDDVIIPSACYELFSEMMSFYGFQINIKKSHVDSPFRESCGGHYYSGVDVKPIYLKGRVNSIPAVYRLANAIRRLAHRRNNLYGCDASFRTVFEHLVREVPKALRFRIPDGLGDGGFIANFDEASPSRVRKGKGVGYQPAPFRVPNVVEVSKTYYDDTIGYLLAALWQLQADEDLDFGFREQVADIARLDPFKDLGGNRAMFQAIARKVRSGTPVGLNSVPLAGRTRYRLVNSMAQQWYDLGPWI